MNGFKELSDIEYTRLRQNLLRLKGSEKQRNFLEEARNTGAFLNRMEKIPTVGSTEAELAPSKMTENEFKEPPPDTEAALYNAWTALPPATACRSTFWANLTLRHIRHGYIQSTFLAANGGKHLGGAEHIDSVLQDSTAQAAERIDRCVRAILRRLGGLPEIRGNRSVYVDCPLARAWWRERWVEQAAQGDPKLAGKIRAVVRIKQNYWEKFVDRIVFRNSTFGSENIRNAFLRSLARFLQSNPDSQLRETKDLQRLCRRTTAYQGRQELSILTDEELDAIMADVIEKTSNITQHNPQSNKRGST